MTLEIDFSSIAPSRSVKLGSSAWCISSSSQPCASSVVVPASAKDAVSVQSWEDLIIRQFVSVGFCVLARKEEMSEQAAAAHTIQ